MKGIIAYLSLLACLVVSCKQDIVKDTLKDLQSQPVKIRLDRMECRMYDRDTVYADSVKPLLRLVTYVDSSVCSPCTLDHMYVWNDFIDESRQYNGKQEYIFVIAPKPGPYHLEDVHLSIESCGLKCPVYVDTAYVFKNDNPHLPTDNRFHTMLLDRNDSVLMVGSPLTNPQVEELFMRIVKSVITNNKN